MTGEQSTRHWADDALWFDIPPFASRGVQPALKFFDTEMAVIEECVKDLEVPENPFTRIFVTVHKLQSEGGGLGLIEISPKTVPVEDEIRLRAYSLYVQRGRRHGFALDDWLEAEAEILGMLRRRA